MKPTSSLDHVSEYSFVAEPVLTNVLCRPVCSCSNASSPSNPLLIFRLSESCFGVRESSYTALLTVADSSFLSCYLAVTTSNDSSWYHVATAASTGLVSPPSFHHPYRGPLLHQLSPDVVRQSSPSCSCLYPLSQVSSSLELWVLQLRELGCQRQMLWQIGHRNCLRLQND